MTAIRWMLFKCPHCDPGTIILKRWGFDHEGTLAMEGFCRVCGNNITITHTFDEQRADAREAFNWWCERQGIQPIDYKLWETEFREE